MPKSGKAKLMPEVGRCYSGDDLAELLGIEVDDRYGLVGFCNDKVAVVARDAGNDCYDVLEILHRQPPIPHCPICGNPMTDGIGTSQSIILEWHEGKWVRTVLDHYETYQCLACSEELSIDELDKLGVPNEIR